MDEQRTIAVVTGTRAEFGLLRPIMQAVAEHDRLRLRTVVTGTHLLTSSKRDIEAAGFRIDAEVEMQRAGETGRLSDAAALGRGVAGMARVIGELSPEFVVVLGDRVEAFAAASAASVAGVRVAHLHGGDRAEGVADEAMRHAITKLAHLHLPATAQSRRRILRMGEPRGAIHRVGSPAIDALRDVQPAAEAPELIVLNHPVGDEADTELRRMRAILHATAGYRRVVLHPNHDPGREGILQAIDHAGVDAVEHLPRARFLSLLKGSRAIVGNSSAGLIEAAALRVPCVNLGHRQAGREAPRHVVHCRNDDDPAAVATAIEQALRLDLRRFRHPYGDGRTGPRVANLLADLDFADIPLRKRNTY